MAEVKKLARVMFFAGQEGALSCRHPTVAELRDAHRALVVVEHQIALILRGMRSALVHYSLKRRTMTVNLPVKNANRRNNVLRNSGLQAPFSVSAGSSEGRAGAPFAGMRPRRGCARDARYLHWHVRSERARRAKGARGKKRRHACAASCSVLFLAFCLPPCSFP